MAKQTRLIMGMPITVEIIDAAADRVFTDVFDYFTAVDNRYSTYKKTSEINRINDGLPENRWSVEIKFVLSLCEQTKHQTNGYFDIEHDGKLDPSGLVKGWAVHNAARLLGAHKLKNFYIEAGGDIQACGLNEQHHPWLVGIRNPFNIAEIIKTLAIANKGVATSGTYVRGQHIYNPHAPHAVITAIKSLTVIGPNVYEADRFATAAFAMGTAGITFIESRTGLEGYMVDSNRTATYTSGFERYVVDA